MSYTEAERYLGEIIGPEILGMTRELKAIGDSYFANLDNEDWERLQEVVADIELHSAAIELYQFEDDLHQFICSSISKYGNYGLFPYQKTPCY